MKGGCEPCRSYTCLCRFYGMGVYMLIKTKDFDYVEVSEKDILSFPNGIYAYENTKEFVLLKNPDNQCLMHLQAVSDDAPRLFLVDPYMFFEEYKPLLPEGTTDLLKAEKANNLSYFVVAVIPENIKNMTVNLRSPVIINFEKRIGAQIILENKGYDVRTRLFPPINDKEAG